MYTKADRANHSSLTSMQEMYALQRANPAYKAFASRPVVIDGVWDDHDYGVNDAGKEIWTKGRQDLFLVRLSAVSGHLQVHPAWPCIRMIGNVLVARDPAVHTSTIHNLQSLGSL